MEQRLIYPLFTCHNIEIMSGRLSRGAVNPFNFENGSITTNRRVTIFVELNSDWRINTNSNGLYRGPSMYKTVCHGNNPLKRAARGCS
jgi:hypothetical protein